MDSWAFEICLHSPNLFLYVPLNPAKVRSEIDIGPGGLLALITDWDALSLAFYEIYRHLIDFHVYISVQLFA